MTSSKDEAETVEDLLANTPTGSGFEAVLANVSFGGIGALLPKSSSVGRLAAALLREPGAAAGPIGDLGARLGQIALGVEETPGAHDRRFRDSAWTDNPILKRLSLGYLAASETATKVLDGADVDWRTREQLRVPLDNVVAALSPSNNPLLNPESGKALIDTGGRNVIAGLRNFLADMGTPAKLPSSVDDTAFALGENIAATPGKVIRRTRIAEIIEYLPTTELVDAVPVLMVPSPVNKFYLLDLEDSVVRAHVDRGRRVFVMSWVNPDKSDADVGFDDYVAGVVDALETVGEVTGSPQSHLLGLCGGGGVVFLTAGYLAATGRQDLLASLTIGIAVIDYAPGPSTMAFMDRPAVDRAVAAANKTGYFDAAASARGFAVIRPVEGIWTNVVNNYLLGHKPPAMGLLYWAADQTNLTARYGAEMLYAALDNAMVEPGGMTVLGVPLDPGEITVDTLVLGASTDHISPWMDCYRTVHHLGGPVEFVLGHGGHAIVVARGPGQSRAKYRTGELAPTAQEWLDGSHENRGSWWDHWTEWVEKLTPDKVPAPTQVGSEAHPPGDEAPGQYVRKMLL